MKRNFWTKVLITAPILAATLAVNAPSIANETADTPLAAHMSLLTSPTDVLGAPVVLHYKITNDSNGRVAADFGLYNTTWYSLKLTDERGNSVPEVTDTRPQHPMGAYAMPYPYISSNASKENDIVVTRWFSIAHPGKYRLAVHVQMPYAAVDASDEGITDQAIRAANTVLAQDFTFALTIRPADVTRLQNLAETLREQYIQQRPDTSFTTPLDALFSMPEAEAAPSWKLMANNPGMDAWGIAERLGRVHSAVAADILAQMRQEPRLSADVQNQISHSLNEMYNSADVPLKAHIRSVAARFGIAMPEKVTIPVPLD